MAQMYPDHLDERTQSQAERTLYTAFREQLDDAYVVFHHVGWVAHDKRKHPHDGEADYPVNISRYQGYHIPHEKWLQKRLQRYAFADFDISVVHSS